MFTIRLPLRCLLTLQKKQQTTDTAAKISLQMYSKLTLLATRISSRLTGIIPSEVSS